MAENRTKATAVDPRGWIDSLPGRRREDGLALLELFTEVTGEPAKMWGPSIVGFGQVRYRTPAGREGEICRTGFSPRRSGLVLYVGAAAQDEALLAKLGKHRTGVGCLYLNHLEGVDRAVLRRVIAACLARPRDAHPSTPRAKSKKKGRTKVGSRSAAQRRGGK
jgi:hypothetical protein